MAKILIVDDERDIRDLFARALQRCGHEPVLATGGPEAVHLVFAEDFDLILTDIRMPGMSGLEFLRQIHDRIESRTPCVIVTAFEEAEYAMEATRLGVRDFLVKPFEIAQLHRVVENALDLRDAWRFRHERQEWLEAERQKLEREMHETLLVFLSEFGEMLESTVHAKDHCRRVALGTADLARACGIEDETRIRDIKLGAILHDVGKVRIDPLIFRKGRDEKLTEEDWAEVRKHPELGARIVEKVPRLAGAVEIVRYHHERYDGKGYPHGLAADEIPVAARMFQIVDAYDCMVDEHRRYKEPKTPREALRELERCSGTQFDPDILAAFAEHVFPKLEREWRENGGRVPINGEVEEDFHSVLEVPEDRPSVRTA